jgi:membrane protease subunit HflC
MMKNLATILAALVVALVLLLYMCTFQVRFTEVAIKKTWGSPNKDAITEPGLYFKWPRPIQSVVLYDKRIRILEDRTEETRTIDGKNLLLTTFTLWRIGNPAKFHTNFPAGVEEGEKKLRSTVITHKHAITGKHEFNDFVTTDPDRRKIREIESEIKAAVAADSHREYGIEVVDFGVKRLGLPTSVTTAIFESMRSHEEAKAARYTAEGDARANDILANARAIERRILAEVDKKVSEIKTDAERVVSDYYKEFSEYPNLRIFLDKLRTAAQAIRERSTIIIDTTESPWNVFDQDARQQVPIDDKLTREPAARPVEKAEASPR